MRCPEHPEVWLYENMLETEGFCPKCQKWYKLPDNGTVEQMEWYHCNNPEKECAYRLENGSCNYTYQCHDQINCYRHIFKYGGADGKRHDSLCVKCKRWTDCMDRSQGENKFYENTQEHTRGECADRCENCKETVDMLYGQNDDGEIIELCTFCGQIENVDTGQILSTGRTSGGN